VSNEYVHLNSRHACTLSYAARVEQSRQAWCTSAGDVDKMTDELSTFVLFVGRRSSVLCRWPQQQTTEHCCYIQHINHNITPLHQHTTVYMSSWRQFSVNVTSVRHTPRNTPCHTRWPKKSDHFDCSHLKKPQLIGMSFDNDQKKINK